MHGCPAQRASGHADVREKSSSGHRVAESLTARTVAAVFFLFARRRPRDVVTCGGGSRAWWLTSSRSPLLPPATAASDVARRVVASLSPEHAGGGGGEVRRSSDTASATAAHLRMGDGGSAGTVLSASGEACGRWSIFLRAAGGNGDKLASRSSVGDDHGLFGEHEPPAASGEKSMRATRRAWRAPRARACGRRAIVHGEPSSLARRRGCGEAREHLRRRRSGRASDGRAWIPSSRGRRFRPLSSSSSGDGASDVARRVVASLSPEHAGGGGGEVRRSSDTASATAARLRMGERRVGGHRPLRERRACGRWSIFLLAAGENGDKLASTELGIAAAACDLRAEVEGGTEGEDGGVRLDDEVEDEWGSSAEVILGVGARGGNKGPIKGSGRSPGAEDGGGGGRVEHR
ncbi:hypothetical protein Dimus_008658 [Dionaea muscipula]